MVIFGVEREQLLILDSFLPLRQPLINRHAHGFKDLSLDSKKACCVAPLSRVLSIIDLRLPVSEAILTARISTRRFTNNSRSYLLLLSMQRLPSSSISSHRTRLRLRAMATSPPPPPSRRTCPGAVPSMVSGFAKSGRIVVAES